ncbi:AbrB family transcriptional regulator [Paenibacillus xerothermodurans]|uniref:AbrB family transcriptional regulator n=1 Tax=Paenibacillus xerothermodurans TaxID=1977292 RepID=A0A2W1P4M4_PAEXE|nr:AbrB family transcriptional regulator [Paenibacillus xerothermodurans]PZE22098.1 AbrB family transcriptional regulator [Paenibacillus xerothermodurans]
MSRITETICVTFIGGVLFTLLHVPLSWMLGPLTAAVVWSSLVRRRLTWPGGLRNAGLALLGYSMGLSFTIDSVISSQLPLMLLATALTLVFSLGVAYITARHTGISGASSVIGSVPGGLSQMVVLSDEVEGADTAVVAFMQTIRLLAVVFVVPFLAVHGLAGGEGTGYAPVGNGEGGYAMPLGALPGAGGHTAMQGVPAVTGGDTAMQGVPALTGGDSGLLSSLAVAAHTVVDRPLFCLLLMAAVIGAAWMAGKLRFPTPYFLGPIIAAGVITVLGLDPPTLPPLVVILAQWCLGVSMGLGIKLNSLSNWRRLLPYSLLGSISVVAFCWTLSYAFSLLQPVSMVTAFLSTAPGGMTEMGVTATLVGADVSLVVAYQMFRILFILFIVPYALRWGFRRYGGGGKAAGTTADR